MIIGFLDVEDSYWLIISLSLTSSNVLSSKDRRSTNGFFTPWTTIVFNPARDTWKILYIWKQRNDTNRLANIVWLKMWTCGGGLCMTFFFLTKQKSTSWRWVGNKISLKTGQSDPKSALIILNCILSLMCPPCCVYSISVFCTMSINLCTFKRKYALYYWQCFFFFTIKEVAFAFFSLCFSLKNVVKNPTLFVLLGTLREDVLCSSVDAVSVKIMGLEKAGPELLLRQVMRHIFIILLFHCKNNAGWYQ